MALPIWENENMLEHLVRSRSWRERLFTLPWQPWTDRKEWTAPSTDVYKMLVPPHYKTYQAGHTQGRVVLMCHPDTAQHIRDAVRQNARSYVDVIRRATEGTLLIDYGEGL